MTDPSPTFSPPSEVDFLRERIREYWREWDEGERAKVERTFQLAVRVLAESTKGHDMTQEINHVHFQVSAWEFAGASYVRSSLWALAAEYAERVALLLRKFVLGLVLP